MCELKVFSSRSKIKEGKADEFMKHYRESVPPIMTGKPHVVVQLANENEDAKIQDD